MLVMPCCVLSDANAGHAVLCFVRCVSRSYGGKRPASLWPYRKSCSPSMPSMPTGRCCGFVILLLPLCIRGYDCNALSFQSAVGQYPRECPCLMSDQNSLSYCFVLQVSFWAASQTLRRCYWLTCHTGTVRCIALSFKSAVGQCLRQYPCLTCQTRTVHGIGLSFKSAVEQRLRPEQFMVSLCPSSQLLNSVSDQNSLLPSHNQAEKHTAKH